MLSIGRLQPGRAEYYLDTVASGIEDYYTGAGEAPGEWIGQSAELLGLKGEVDDDDLHSVLDSFFPGSGERMTRAQGAPKVPGFDTTFSAPKSVSLLFALGSPEVSNEVRNAHDAAVRASVRFLETEAARARRGKGGLTQIEADGLVGAAFRHRTSRSGDPQLHTHVLIANVVHAPSDDRWSALDARPLFGWAKTAGYLYEAHLRHELTERLGVEWEPVADGIADVAGLGPEVLAEFSQRRQQIEDHLWQRGLTSGRAAQIAAYATRDAKDRTTTADEMLADWRDRAIEHGVDERSLDDLCGVTVRHELTPDDIDRLFTAMAAPDGLTEQRASFGRRNVIEAICEALPQGASSDRVNDLANDFLRFSDVVALGEVEGEHIHRADGTTAPARADDRRYTTTEMLSVEQRVIGLATASTASGRGVVNVGVVRGACEERPALSEEQQAMVETVCRSGNGIDIVEGAAGAGKTFALATANEAWTRVGYRPVGVALAARAAQELEDGSGIPSMTLDRFLNQLDRHTTTIDQRSVIVVDEAAMVGTRKLARLLEHTDQAGAKVVLVGDPHQLPEIDAGGAFIGLSERLTAAQLTDNRRQREPWEREALTELRTGDPNRALDAYRVHGRVHETADIDNAVEALVDAWLEARTAGEEPIMLARRRSQVDALNDHARQSLQVTGEIGPDIAHADGRPFAIGDHVMALHNDYRLGLVNGHRGTITAIEANHMDVAIEQRRLVRIPAGYILDRHLTHAYAMTIHKTQGATVGRALLLADDGLTREQLYTAMSRGASRNDIYLVAEDRRVDQRHAPEATREPDHVLRESAQRSGAKTMASDEAASPARTDPVERERLVRAEFHRTRADIDATTKRLRDAQRRRRDATDGLDRLPRWPLARRERKHALTEKLSTARDDIAEAEPKIARLESSLTRLSDELREVGRARDVEPFGGEPVKSRPAAERTQVDRGVDQDRGVGIEL